MIKQVQDESIWEWTQCTYDMKRIIKDTQTSWNLSPQISLKIPHENGILDPIINLKIDQSRPFIFTEGLGWNWHKSWNLPDIGLELEITDPHTLERLAPPNNIYCKMHIVKPTMTPMKTFYLMEIGAKGNLKVDMENGKCIFSGLKFNTTSYNHDHQKFHIVITLYLCQNKFEFPQILESRISPPIFVDSRKSARDIIKQKIQKLQSYFEPFQPNNLEKQFIIIKTSNTEPIKNSIEGIINYFSAPNIRHKVKHPLFLLLRFNKCISLYINSSKIEFNHPEQFIQTLQHILSNSNAMQGIQKIEQKSILLCVETISIENKANQKKITEFLEPLNNDCVQVLINPIDVPKNFIKITNFNELQQAYHKIYESLFQYRRENSQYDQDLEDEYIAKLPEKKKKKELKEIELINTERIRKIIHIQGINPEQQNNLINDEHKFFPNEKPSLKLPLNDISTTQQTNFQNYSQNLQFNPTSLWTFLQKLPQQ